MRGLCMHEADGRIYIYLPASLPTFMKYKQLNAELEGEGQGQACFSAEEALAIVQAADEQGKLFWEENARVIYS